MVLVEVKRKFNTKICRVSINGVPLTFEDNVATRNLPPGAKVMSWHVEGNAGQTYEIHVVMPKGIECHPDETLKGGMTFGACEFTL